VLSRVFRIFGACIDVALVALACVLIVRRPVQGPLRVVVSIGGTVYQDFFVRPGAEVVTYRVDQGSEVVDGDGWTWSVCHGPRILVCVTNWL
jgi:hypothetical protein